MDFVARYSENFIAAFRPSKELVAILQQEKVFFAVKEYTNAQKQSAKARKRQ